jgi:hypothetical protein
LVLSDVLGVHRVELQALASNSCAINCYLACGFRHEGVRREAELNPDGWKGFIMMGILRSEHTTRTKTAHGSDSADVAARRKVPAANVPSTTRRPGRAAPHGLERCSYSAGVLGTA